MRLRVWEPFRRVAPFYADFDKLANEAEGTWHPSVDISENENAFVLKAELPGVNREDINIDINNKTLTLKGEKKHERDEEKDNVHMTERAYGSFQRSMPIPDRVDAEKISARFDKGVLKVVMPKKAESVAPSRKIDIEK